MRQGVEGWLPASSRGHSHGLYGVHKLIQGGGTRRKGGGIGGGSVGGKVSSSWIGESGGIRCPEGTR